MSFLDKAKQAAKDVERPPSIEEVLRRWARAYPERAARRVPLLIKFTLAPTHAGYVLGRLRQAGVWAGTIYPNYDGVVQGLEERFYYPQGLANEAK